MILFNSKKKTHSSDEKDNVDVLAKSPLSFELMYFSALHRQLYHETVRRDTAHWESGQIMLQVLKC